MKPLEWKALLIGTLATLLIVMALVALASVLADIVLLSTHNKEYTFSFFSKTDSGFFVFSLDPKQADAGYTTDYEHFYKKWFPIISLVVSTLGFLLGGFLTGRIAKTRFVLHGVIAGTIIATIFLSWITPIRIAGAYLGAALARHKKAKQEVQ